MPTADEAPSSPFLLTFDFTQDVQGCLSREHNADSARVHMQDSLLFNALSEVQSMHRHVRSKHSTPKEGRQQESSQRRCVSPRGEARPHLPGAPPWPPDEDKRKQTSWSMEDTAQRLLSPFTDHW